MVQLLYSCASIALQRIAGQFTRCAFDKWVYENY